MDVISKINKYIAGDQSLRDSLIIDLLPIAKQLGDYYARRYATRGDDIRSQALLGLVQAVEWLPTRLRESADPHGYVFMTVRRFITTGTVTIPGILFDSLIRIPLHELQAGFKYIGILSLDVENNEEGVNLLNTLAYQSKSEPLGVKLNDILQSVANLLSEGYTYREIGELLNKSKSWVSNQIQEIKQIYSRALECV